MRRQRQLIYTFPQAPVRASWAGGEGYTCITSRGILGSCQSFTKCYPFFKNPPPGVKYPVLQVWDSWVLGNQDACSFYTNDGRQAQGVCCTNPITPSDPPTSDGTEQNKLDLPPVQNIPTFGGWPPQIPTHPPDHTPATHPPSLFDPVTTQKPFIKPTTTTTTRRTTWATRPTKPVFGQTTTKRPSFITTTTTEASIINDVSFDAGSCGAKNGFMVRIIKIKKLIAQILVSGSRANCWRTKCRSK